MAESGAVSTIFVVIRSCNRSVPCMEVVGYAVQVLLNVAKVPFHFKHKALTVKEHDPANEILCLLIISSCF